MSATDNGFGQPKGVQGWMKWLWYFIVGGVVASLLGTALWVLGTQCVAKPPEKVAGLTILVPVQGDQRPQESNKPLEPYYAKISNDVVRTILNARLGFEEKFHAAEDRDLITFDHYAEGNTDTERRTIAQKHIDDALRNGRPAVAVIGHTSSQATLDAAPVYAKNALAMLMPFATKTGITHDVMTPSGVPRALAFPPSNRAQARTMLKWLHHKDVGSIIVFRDAVNPAYSNDCGNELLQMIEDQILQKEPPYIQLVADITVGGAPSGWYVNNDILESNVDAFVIIGMTKASVEIVRQTLRHSSRPKIILLADGAVDENLVPRLAASLVKIQQPPEIYITFPENEVIPQGYEAIFHDGGRVVGLSHSAFLADAIFVAYQAASQVLKTATPKTAAAAFTAQLTRNLVATADGPSIAASQLLGPNRLYQFAPDGSRSENVDYTVYLVDPGTLHKPNQQGYVRQSFQ